ncbi:hypothetical protein BCR44DRAFT_46978 [Catenaria anguillulae PL171]|uniref:Ankyrin repeat-containing domain protein n=1 Tax=Catenaria anguillulae PL171 TaxID=765915 RepID=A0A1Y2HL69_9FUNG|nr:hypothetical protein BCR44DRAFT_46978 [Catenaria anguillulae PL171]
MTANIALPFELVEAILAALPKAIRRNQDSSTLCWPILTVVKPTPSILRAVIPRLERDVDDWLSPEINLDHVKKWHAFGGRFSEERLAVLALLSNRVDVLQWLIVDTKWLPPPPEYPNLLDPTYAWAVERGAYAAVTWLAKNAPDSTLRSLGRVTLDDDVLGGLIRNGGQEGIELVKAWVEQDHWIEEYIEDTMIAAAEVGRLDLFQAWARRCGDLEDELEVGGRDALGAAAQLGHIHVFEWWVQNRWDLPCELIQDACSAGRVDVLAWLMDHLGDGKLDCSDEALVLATKNGHREVLRWWKESGLEVDWQTEDLIQEAEEAGHVHVAAWLRAEFDGEESE